MRHADRMLKVAVCAALGVSFAAGTVVSGQVLVDGTRDASGYTQLAVQTANSGFGDSNNTTNSPGSELDNLWYNVDLATGRLNLFLGGNLETNNNKLVLFLDTYAGGQNVLRGDNPDVNFNNLNTKYEGFTFDTGFDADHFIALSRDAGDGGANPGSLYVDYSQLRTSGGGKGGYVGRIDVTGIGTNQQGSGTPGGPDSTPDLLPMTVGFNDNNAAGVTGAGGTPADPIAAAAVTTGAELSLDLAALGIEGDFRIVALINGSSHDYLSNQILAGFDGTQGNLGGDGAGNFTGTVGAINLNNFAGNQYVSVPVTIPTIAWNVNANGTYSTGANFAGGVVPNGVNGRVLFGSAITAPRSVNVDQPVSLIRMTFDNANTYTLNGSGAITVTGISVTPAIRVLSGTHRIEVPLTFNNDARIDTAANSGLVITQPLNAAGKNLFKQGAGSLSIAPSKLNSISVNAGTLAFGSAGATVVRGLTVDTGAVLNLGASAMIIDYDEGFSPRDRLNGYIADGRMLSTTAGTNRRIGYIDTAALPTVLQYGGEPVDSTALVYRQTLIGDADLNLTVNFDDLLVLAKNYNSTGKFWYQADFDYDGDVDFDDLLGLAKSYNSSISAAQLASLPTSFASDFALAQSLVPEPTVMLGGLLGGALLGRRRRN